MPSRTTLIRERMYELGGVEAPAPRAHFVADLESRLANLIDSSVRGDVLPELELAPPVPVTRRMPPMTAAMVAVCMIVLVAFSATSGISSSRAIRAGGGSDRHDRGDDSSGRGAPVLAGESGLHAVVVERRADADATPAPIGREPRASGTIPSPSSTLPATPGVDPSSAAAPASPETDRTVAPLALSAVGTAARVRLDWERYAGDDFAAYLVLRANAPDEPDHPDSSGRTLMLLRIENREMVSHQDTPKVGAYPRYRVVVVDRNGVVIARSDAVAPEFAVRGAESSMTLVRRAGGEP